MLTHLPNQLLTLYCILEDIPSSFDQSFPFSNHLVPRHHGFGFVTLHRRAVSAFEALHGDAGVVDDKSRPPPAWTRVEKAICVGLDGHA